MAMVLRIASPSRRNRVSIVKPDQPRAARAMQGQRIVEPLRLLWRGRNARHDEPYPIFALWIDNEHLAIQVEKKIQGRIANRPHGRIVIIL